MPRASVVGLILSLAGGAAVGASPNSPATVPIEIVDKAPVLTALVGGRPVSLMFDLGGSDELVLSTEAIGELTVERLPEPYTWLDFQGAKHETLRFHVADLTIGALKFPRASGHEDANWEGRQKRSGGNLPGSRGYFGPELIRSYKLVVNYKDKSLTFIPSKEGNPEKHGCYGTEIGFEPELEFVTKVRTDIGEHRFVWDTGAPMMIVRKSIFAGRSATSDGEVIQSKQFVLGDLNFGPMKLRMLNFSEPAEVDGYVGYDFFAENIVCIDMQNKRFLVRQHSR